MFDSSGGSAPCCLFLFYFKFLLYMVMCLVVLAVGDLPSALVLFNMSIIVVCFWHWRWCICFLPPFTLITLPSRAVCICFDTNALGYDVHIAQAGYPVLCLLYILCGAVVIMASYGIKVIYAKNYKCTSLFSNP